MSGLNISKLIVILFVITSRMTIVTTHLSTKQQVTDLLTKVLGRVQHYALLEQMGVMRVNDIFCTNASPRGYLIGGGEWVISVFSVIILRGM